MAVNWTSMPGLSDDESLIEVMSTSFETAASEHIAMPSRIASSSESVREAALMPSRVIVVDQDT